MKEYADKLARECVSKKEQLIKDAINHAMMREDWIISDIVDRVRMTILPDNTEIFSFDGKDMIHFGHIKTEMGGERMDFYLKATQEYKILYDK